MKLFKILNVFKYFENYNQILSDEYFILILNIVLIFEVIIISISFVYLYIEKCFHIVTPFSVRFTTAK